MRRSTQALHNGNASAAQTGQIAAPVLFAFFFLFCVCFFFFYVCWSLWYFLCGYMSVWWHKTQWIFVWTHFLPSLNSSLSWSSSPFFSPVRKASAILYGLPVKPLNVLTENELIKLLILQLDQSTNIFFPSEALQRILLLLRPELEILARYSCSMHTEERIASS